MTGLQRPGYQSGLTVAIERNKDISMIEVLKHPDLAITVRNEARALIDYWRDTDSNRGDGGPRLYTLIEWALTKKWNTGEASLTGAFKLYQLNRNASTVLASPSTKLRNLFREERCSKGYQMLLDFIGSDLALDTLFAGHFQRILESFFRAFRDWQALLTDNAPKLIGFILTNCHILPYQQLVCHLVVDFSNVLDLWEHMMPSQFLVRLLRKAAAYVFAIRETMPRETPPPSPAPPTADPEVSSGFGQPPLNWKGERTLSARGKKCTMTDYSLSHRTRRYEELYYKHRACVTDGPDGEAIPTGTVRDLQRHVYVLLHSIQIMSGETSELLDWLSQTDDVIRLLLTCGVYADSTSMISPQAFRLVYRALYVKEEGDAVKPEFDISDEKKGIVDEFADAFLFSHDITEQMIAAFPIFWNHRYEDLETLGNYPDVTVEPAFDCPGFPVHRPKGCTPLQFFGYCLVDEPSVSDVLNRSIMDALAHLNNKRKEAFDQKDWEKVIELDTFYFEFLRTKHQDLDIGALADVIPFGLDDPQAKETPERSRVHLSGSAHDFAIFRIRDELFFDLSIGWSPLFRRGPRLYDPKVMFTCVEREDLMSRLDKMKAGKPSPDEDPAPGAPDGSK
jgi:hypothetical protein